MVQHLGTPQLTPSSPVTIVEGDDLSVVCSVTSDPASPTLQWSKDGTREPAGATLRKNPVTQSDAGTYTCTATNACSTSAQLVVDVQYPPDGNPVCTVTTSGNNVVLRCELQGGNPAVDLVWTYGNGQSAGTSQESVNQVNAPVTAEGTTYTCTATSVALNPGRTCSATLAAPSVTVSPQPTSTVLLGTASHSLTCTVDSPGVPAASALTWTGPAVTAGRTTGGTLTTPSLTISGVEKTDAGDYTCTATNLVGDGSDSLSLVVQYPPELTVTATPNPVDETQSVSLTSVSCQCSRHADSIQGQGQGQGQCICRRGWRGNGTFCEPLSDTLEVELLVIGENWRPGLDDCASVDFQTLANRFDKEIRKFYRDHLVAVLSLAITRFFDGSLYVVHTVTFPNHMEHHHLIEMFEEFDNDTGLYFDGHAVRELCHVGFCENDGTCREEGFDRVCDCPSGYSGLLCENQGPGGDNTTTIIIAVVVVCVIVLLAVIAVAVVVTRRRKSAANKKTVENHVNNINLDHVQGEADDGYQSLRIPHRQSSDHTYQGLTARSDKELASDGAYEDVKTPSEFPRNQLAIKEELGHGEFGCVYKAEAWNISGSVGTTVVAAKELKGMSPTASTAFFKELAVLKLLGTHPNVVSFLGCCTDAEPFYLLLEYVSGGSLQSNLRTSRTQQTYGNLHGGSKSLSSRDLTKFAWDVAKGMSFLSAKKIIHRDLATRNVLVSADRTCKVSDFGFSREGDEYERTTKVSTAVPHFPRIYHSS
ncbi:uncharacterized protein LOC118404297 [Branchiostoma floridae]|uniref:receptor protein-tyrosine kinase n=1 Tax=Branchiostoma floridae TaxID=7739 RepID=A0A9J7KGP9_BRAFL|nr:uncharacterized protein LOC118404297 [Branchiostoma floridae]